MPKRSTSKRDSPDERSRSLFERFAKTYDQEVQRAVQFSGKDVSFFVNAKVDILHDLMTEHLGKVAETSVLDVGCGTASIHGKLIEAGVKITGVDVASEPLEIARKAHPLGRYEVFEGVSLPFENESFDVTVAVCVLHHVAAHEQKALVEEMRRVTRRGGLVVIIEHNPLNPLTRYVVWRCPFDEDAVLLSARRSRALLSLVGKTALRYFLLSPFRHPGFLAVERALSSIPVGAQYCAYAVNENVALRRNAPRGKSLA
jgi:SAM-dependent methyltransferase